MSRYKYPFIIKDSKQNMYKFTMNENNDLALERYSENTMKTKVILKENIYNFTVDIDDKDVIHVIYIDKSSSIKYSTYSTELTDNSYFSVKDENNDYRFLFFKFIIDRLYLFFISRPDNNTHCILKTCIIKDNNVTIKNIITVNCSRYTCPYFIYSTTDFIYIMYSKDSTEKYSIQVLDVHKNKCQEHLNIITLEKASHINFIIKDNTALICYNSFQSKNIELRITSVNLKTYPPLVKNQILLLNTNFTSLHPLILNFENHTYALLEEGSRLAYYNFIDDELVMVKKQYISIEKSEIHYANYRSNFRESINLNSTIAYTLNDNFLYVITDLQNIINYKAKEISKEMSNELQKEVLPLKELCHDNECIPLVPINIDFLEITPYLNNYFKELYISDRDNTELLSECIKKNKKLNDDIDSLTRLNSSYKVRIEDLKNRLIKYQNDSAIVLTRYKNVIADMENEKKRILNIIDEKDDKILSLHRIINSHKK